MRCISIHALVKRATKPVDKVMVADVISIHALVKRATFFKINNKTVFSFISIHALVKRATNVV